MIEITNSRNQRIKDVAKLDKANVTVKRQGLFVVEGLRENILAQRAGYVLKKYLFVMSSSKKMKPTT
jgi:hypothetical protein